MKFKLITAWFAVSSLAAISAHAQTVDLSWDNCAPIATNKVLPEGAPVTFYASVTGQSEGHAAYEIWWLIGDSQQSLPDAWRFDGAGCTASLFAYNSRPPHELQSSCPPFAANTQPQYPMSVFQLASSTVLPVPSTAGIGMFVISYPNKVMSADPGMRYHLVQFMHDFTYASIGETTPDACGGFGNTMTIQLMPNKVNWLDVNGVERRWSVGNGTLTFQGVSRNTVPAVAATWGSIKGQYRN
jgi:hypothetical protein